MAGRRKSSKRGTSVRKSYRSKKLGKMVLTRGPTYAPELKHYDAKVSMSIPANQTFGVHSILCTPAQGTDFINRIGRKIQVRQLEVNCSIIVSNPGQLKATGDMIVCDIWLDTECKGTLASATDIYDTDVHTLPLYSASQNASNIKRFKRLTRTLHDVVVSQMDAAGAFVQAANTRELVPINIKLNKVFDFNNAGTGFVADLLNYNVICAMASSRGYTGASPYVGSEITYRFWYVDL